MSQKDIREKIDTLADALVINGEFHERDVVYLLVEIYKIKERDLKSRREEIKNTFVYLAFFRDWVVHTHMNSPEWVRRKEELNNPEALFKQLLDVFDNESTRQKLAGMQASFIEALGMVTKDQDIG